MFRRILVGIDGSEDARKALSVASGLAAGYGARLIVAHALMRDAGFDVLRKLANRRTLSKLQRDELDSYGAKTRAAGTGSTEVLPPTELVHAIGRQLLDRAQDAAKKAGVKRVATALLIGDAADALLQHAERERADLIVVGRLGFSTLGSVVVGTVSHKIGSRALCSCLIVR